MKNDTTKKITIDALARLVVEKFDGMEEKMDNRFDELKSDIGRVETDISVLKTDVKEIKANLNKKVDKIEYNTLEYRVEKLEKKSV